MNNANSARDWLLSEFERIKSRNNRFTLRAMARRTGLSPGRLSEFLAGKRPITVKAAEKISSRLALEPRRKQEFIAAASATSIANRMRGGAGASGVLRVPLKNDYRKIEMDHFAVIADWYHFAILSLMELPSFRQSEAWIAKRLGVSPLQVKSALGRLERVGLIDRAEKWISTGKHLETPTDVASSALKKSHRQDLKKAIEALDDVAIEERDITSMTMAIDIDRLPEAKKRIREFRKSMAEFLEEGKANEVYSLNVQLIPITKKMNEDKV